MIPGENERFEEAVCDALELPPSDRESFLKKSLWDCPDLQAQALALIKRASSVNDLDPPASLSGRLGQSLLLRRAERPVPHTLVGRIIDERYEILIPIGSGGFGDAYKCRDLERGDLVVLKVLTGLQDPTKLAANRESSALRRLHSQLTISHRDVCTVDTFPCIVTDFVDGLPFPGASPGAWDQTADLFLSLLCAVSYLHSSGIAHGDLKPPNVLVVDDAVRLIDFGVADGTAFGSVPDPQLVHAGTPEYMAPERLPGGPPSVAADLYAAGAMLYEVLVGEPPHRPEERDGLMARRMRGPPPLDDAIAGRLPQSVETMLRSLLAADPAARPSSQELIGQLVEAGHGPLPLHTIRSRLARGSSASLGTVSQEDILNLLSGSDRWMQLKTRSAKLLHRRSGGLLRALLAELTTWCLSGWLRAEGKQLRVLPRAAPMLWLNEPSPGADPESAQMPTPEALLNSGRVREAWDAALPIAQSSRALRDRYAPLRDLFLCALAESAPERLGHVLAEIECGGQLTTPEQYLHRLSRAAILALRGHASRAFALADHEQPPVDPALRLPWMSVLLMAAQRLPDGLQDDVLDACARVADDVEGGASKYEEGLGWRFYRRGMHGQSAAHHARAGALARTPSARLSCLLNEADVRLEMGDHAGAKRAAARALPTAVQTNHVLRQARAEYVLRAADYRDEVTMEADVDLVDAARGLGCHNQAAMVLLSEAAIAWRAGSGLAGTCAREARDIWSSLDRAPAAMLADSLVCATGERREAPAHEEEALLGALDGPKWHLATQAAGLLALADAGTPRVYRRAARVVDRRGEGDMNRRREVVSLRETTDALRRRLA